MKMEEVKPRKRTRVKPGYVRKTQISLLKTREALYLPCGGGCKDDNGNYHLKSAYVILREDWEEDNDFLFAPQLSDITTGRFVAQFVGDCIVNDVDVLEKVHMNIDKNDFLEVVKKHLEQ